MIGLRYGFRVTGSCRTARRLVDADRAMTAYAACDPRAETTRESYLSLYRFGPDFARHLERTGSTAGFNGPCWARFLWFDLDRADLREALDAARRLVASVTSTLRIDDDDVLAFFSGSKGFHIGVPTCLWQPTPGASFHRIAKHFAVGLADRAGVTIDAGIYDRVRCFRAPNSLHPRTGLRKRWVPPDLRMSIGAIVKLAEAPEAFDLPTPTHESDAAAKLWAASVEHVRREAETRRSVRPGSGAGAECVNRATLNFIRAGAPAGGRHRLLYSASADLAEHGAPLELCVALLSEAALDAGLPPTDVRRAITNGHRSATADVAGGDP